MAIPSKVVIHEVGPREGLQILKEIIPTDRKVQLVDMLSECRLPEIEVTSFVSPKWVPQMADAEQLVAAIRQAPGTAYTGIFLNGEGMDRAIATKRLNLSGVLSTTASETFSQRNTKRSIEDTFRYSAERLAAYRERSIPVETVSVMAAFGCNYEGDIAPKKVLGLLHRLMDMAAEHDVDVKMIQLADTMGWATPPSIRRLVGMVQDVWPDAGINLHLHDTRGMAVANAYAALEMGVDDFDSSVGGIGGCPFAGFKGAAGNVATEDLVHLCEELGIETGVDLERLCEVAREIGPLLGIAPPGKVMYGGTLRSQRARAAG